MATGYLLDVVGTTLQYFTDQGVVLSGGTVSTFLAATTTPQETWTDSTLSVSNGPVITLASNGRLPASCWVPSGMSIKMVLSDGAGNPIPNGTVDNLQGINDPAFGGTYYAKTGAETSAGVAPINYSYPPGNVKRYGAAGDNGLDDTAAIQNAVKVAGVSGTSVFLPNGTYRITAPIDFSINALPSPTYSFDFAGESVLQTIINANFASGTKQAALSVNYGGPTATSATSASPRVFPRFRNFKISGINDPKTMGIFCNWTGSFGFMQDVYVTGFYNGVMVANDYNMKMVRVTSNSNLNNGIMFGYLPDGINTGSCNNNTLENCFANANVANGVYMLNNRAMAMLQCNCESNGTANIYLDTVRGGAIVGQYMEYADTLGGSPTAQLYIKNSLGISVNGLSVSSFRSTGAPIIWLADANNGIKLDGIAIEYASGPANTTIGIEVTNSFGVSIRSSYLGYAKVGVSMDATSRATIEDVTFTNNTIPVQTNNSANCVLDWRMCNATDVGNSSFGAASIVDLEYITGDEWKVLSYRAFNVTALFSDLSSAGVKNVILHRLPAEQWRIADVLSTVVTGFSGGGGNRNLQVTDATHIYTVVPAASLTTGKEARWGSTDVPFPATASDMTSPTTAGANLNIAYSDGTTDYSAGQINITVVAQRIA